MNTTQLAGLGLAALLLSGCSQWQQAQQHPYIAGQQPDVARAIQVRPVAYRFSIHLDGRQLDNQDRQALTDFLRSHGPLVNQRLVIVERGAVYERRQLERWMRQLGIASHQVRFQTQADERRLVDVTTEYFVARTPDCPDHDMVPGTPLHQQHRSANFGCATASNLAMMVSDPRELVKGRQLAPASGTRAVSTMRRYQQNIVVPLPEGSGIVGARVSGGSGGGE